MERKNIEQAGGGAVAGVDPRATLVNWHDELSFVAGTLEMMATCNYDEMESGGFERARFVLHEAVNRCIDLQGQIETVRANGGLKFVQP